MGRAESEAIINLWSDLGKEIYALRSMSESWSEENRSLQNTIRQLKEQLAVARHDVDVTGVDHNDVAEEGFSTRESNNTQSTQPTSTPTGSRLSHLVEKHPTIVEVFKRKNQIQPVSRPATRRSYNSWWDFQWEAHRSTDGHFVSRIVKNPLFDMAVGVLIVINAICMAGESQHIGRKIAYEIKFRGYYDHAWDGPWDAANVVFDVMDKVCTVVFGLELVLRFFVFGTPLLREGLIYIDMVAVGAGLLHWILQAEYALANMLLRFLRIARLVARCLRLLKLTKFIESLHILVKSISASVSTLFWSLVLLIIFQIVAGMMLSQLVLPIILDESGDVYERQQVFSYYGTFTRSQITMFEIHLANFGTPCRILVDYCGEFYAFIFLAYRCLAGFAVLNVINAVFIQQTISLASKDSEIICFNRRKEVMHYRRDLNRLFKELDTDLDGELTASEWHNVKSNPRFVHVMNALELNAADMSSLFDLIDTNADGVITVEEFIDSALCLKGSARSVDILAVLAQLHAIGRDISRLQAGVAAGSSAPLTPARPRAPSTLFADADGHAAILSHTSSPLLADSRDVVSSDMVSPTSDVMSPTREEATASGCESTVKSKPVPVMI